MKLKEKIKNHLPIVGMHVCLGDIASARIAGLAGYDFIWVDMEHSNVNLDNLLGHLIAIQAGGTEVIVRLPQDDLTFTKRVLEMGPDGVIFPMVKSAGQAKMLMDWTLYPPYGNRGFGPQHAVKYGYESTAEYAAATCDHLCRFIQIEHIDAVNDLENIVQNPYIDGYIFGPCDLSGSIGELGQVYGANTTALIKKSIDILKAAGKYVGVSTGDTSIEGLTHWHDMGIDMISAGADFEYLQQMAVSNLKKLELIHKK